jgi:hypothetical protein
LRRCGEAKSLLGAREGFAQRHGRHKQGLSLHARGQEGVRVGLVDHEALDVGTLGLCQRRESGVVDARVLRDRVTVKFWVNPVFKGARYRTLPDPLVERHGLDAAEHAQRVVQYMLRGALHRLNEVRLQFAERDFILLMAKVHAPPLTLVGRFLKNRTTLLAAKRAPQALLV